MRERCGERKMKKNEERRMKSEERGGEDRERGSHGEMGTVGPAPAPRVTECIAVLSPTVHDKTDSQ